MLDLAWLCNLAVRAVYALVLLACNFLGYSPVWATHAWKKRQHEGESNHLKVPSHLAVSFSDRKVRKNELLSLLDCCLSTGIRKLSLYDPWNDCIGMEQQLRVFCKARSIDLLIDVGPCSRVSSSKLTVQLLSAASGRSTLVDACRKLSGGSSPITVPAVTSLLNEKYGLTEPELLLQVGQTPSLAGYPPWSLRVTEFVQVSSLPCSRSSFEDCLVSFSKRDIRLGK